MDWAKLGLSGAVAVVASVLAPSLSFSLRPNYPVLVLGLAISVFAALKPRQEKSPLGFARHQRVTAKLEDDKEFVVFLIGFSISDPLAVLKSLFTKEGRHKLHAAMQMPKMIEELQNDPASGFLHVETYGGPGNLFGRPSMMIQYWKSEEDLIRFARGKSNTHYPAWLEFNKAMRTAKDGTYGIFHETYVVKSHECIYRGVPQNFGLCGAALRSQELFRVGGVAPVGKASASAKLRLGAKDGALESMEGFKDYKN